MYQCSLLSIATQNWWLGLQQPVIVAVHCSKNRKISNYLQLPNPLQHLLRTATSVNQAYGEMEEQTMENLWSISFRPFQGVVNRDGLFLNGPFAASFLLLYRASFQATVKVNHKQVADHLVGMQCWYLNPQPLDYQSPPITTWPGLDSVNKISCIKLCFAVLFGSTLISWKILNGQSEPTKPAQCNITLKVFCISSPTLRPSFCL